MCEELYYIDINIKILSTIFRILLKRLKGFLFYSCFAPTGIQSLHLKYPSANTSSMHVP